MEDRDCGSPYINLTNHVGRTKSQLGFWSLLACSCFLYNETVGNPSTSGPSFYQLQFIDLVGWV